MQQHFSYPVEPEILQPEAQTPALPVPSGYTPVTATPAAYVPQHAVPAHPAQLQYMPPLDSYSSVCVRVREASIIASNEPIAFNSGGNVPPLPPVKQADASRKRFSPVLVAAWLCVLQLGIIITLLAGQSWHIDQAVGSIKQSLGSLAVPKLQSFLHAGDVAFGDDQEVSAPKAVGANKKKTHAHASKSKKALGGIQFAWPSANNFVPPPPPTMPTEKLMVPPPPVAFNFPGGPGAVAASTLPPVAASVAEPVKKSPTETAKKHAIEPSNSDGASIGTVPEPPAAKTQTKAQAPVPGQSGLLSAATVSGSAASLSNEEPPFFGADENEPLILPGPMPTAASAPAPAPAIAPARQPAAVHPPVPAIRTVISGNRKRIIADR